MLFEISFFRGFKGAQDSEIVEAIDIDSAELVFEHHFPKKVKFIFSIDEFIYDPSFMKPLSEITIYKDPYPRLNEIDWSQITLNDVERVLKNINLESRLKC